MIRPDDAKQLGRAVGGTEAVRRAQLFREYVQAQGLPPNAPIPAGLAADAEAFVRQGLEAWQAQNGGSGAHEAPVRSGASPLTMLAQANALKEELRPRRLRAVAAAEPWAVVRLLEPRPNQKGVDALSQLVGRLLESPGAEQALDSPRSLRLFFSAVASLARGERHDVDQALAEALAAPPGGPPLSFYETELILLRDLTVLLVRSARGYHFPKEAFSTEAMRAAITQILVHLASGGALDRKAQTRLRDLLDRVDVPVAS